MTDKEAKTQQPIPTVKVEAEQLSEHIIEGLRRLGDDVPQSKIDDINAHTLALITREVSLLELCDEIATAARRATGGAWVNATTPGSEHRPFAGAVYSNAERPDACTGLIAESVGQHDIAHILATQPRVAMAIAAKLCDAVSIIHGAADAMYALEQWSGAANLPERLQGQIALVLKRAMSFTTIEVP